MNEIFSAQFEVQAPLKIVSDFHASTRALKQLTPPPMWVQFHQLDALAEGSVADFTMWLLFFPIHWRAVHHEITKNGFVDEMETGPMQVWRHEHRFEVVTESQTRIIDTVHFQHYPGFSGFLSKLLFNRLGLKFLFWYRGVRTRLALNGKF